MVQKALGSLVVLVVTVVVLASCSGNINNPSPSIRSISPSSQLQGSPGFTLSVTGSGFAPQSAVLWNGSPRLTLFQSSNLLTATITPSDLTNPVTIPITVFNPSPGGGTSNSINFTINPSTTLVPQVTMLSPSGAFAGGPSFTLQVTGNNFVPQSIVTLNNSNQITSFVSSTTLLAAIDSSSIASAGTDQVGVLNPPPGGGASNTLQFLISNAPPTLSSLSPNTTATGQTSLSVTVSGMGFSSASIVNINGSARATGFNGNVQLTVMLTQADLAAAGTLQMQVFNPPPGGGISNVLPFSIIPSSTGTGLPELVDIATDGSQANQGIGNLTNSGPSMGMSGRFIAFASISTNLIAGDSDSVHLQDVYARDTCLGMTTGCVPQTIAVNLATSGAEANAASFEPSMSGSGRFVAFTSTATNLVAAAISGAREIYLRDTCLGGLNCTPQTTLVSVASDGMSAANGGDSFQPSLSPDGRYVAFVSMATNLITGISGPQIYLRDTCVGAASGCTAKTFLVSTPDGTTAANGVSLQPAAANNGLFVAFSSTATNLVSGVNSGIQQIFLRSTCVNVASGCTTATKLVSAADAGGTAPAGAAAQQSSVSTDGRFVAFASTAGNLGFATGGFQQIFLRDMCSGVASGCTPSTKLVSSPDGTTAGNAASSSPQASNNGQFIAFTSNANNLVASDTNGLQDVFVRNTCAGVTGSCTAKTVLASVNSAGQQGNGASLSPAISGDGHFVTFISSANNLVPRDVNGFEDIFLAVTTF